MKKTIEEVAEERYREYPNNPLQEYNRDANCFRKRKAFIAGAKYQSEQMYSEEDLKDGFKRGLVIGAKYQSGKIYIEEDMIQFSEWTSHNDWVYLPSKNYWVNEEHEELEQKLSSKEIIKQWKESQS